MSDAYSQVGLREIVFGGGCFWGVEDLVRDLPGVIDTEVGYAGGNNDNPTYDNHPGHAEVVKVVYDPKEISLKRLLDFFFTIHDPTTVNRQGNDVGESYRSVIFYADDEERLMAQRMIDKVNKSGRWRSEVVTKLEPYKQFYAAEPEHQDYLKKNPGGYSCHYQRFASYD